MSVTTRTLPRSELSYERTSRDGMVCRYVAETYVVRSIGQVVTSDAEPESRPKPEVLLQALTGRSPQYVESNIFALARSPWIVFSAAKTCQYRTYSREQKSPMVVAPPSTGWEERSRNQVANEAVNLSQGCFEYRQTAKLFVDAAQMADNLWEEYRGRKRYRRKNTVANVAGAKLTASFGLVPTLSDLSDSIEVLRARLGEDMLLRYVRGIAKGKKSLEVDSLGKPLTGSWERSQRWSIYVAYHTDPRDFTMGNPASLAWELTPWSWLVDGLVGVGSWLSSLDALSGVRWMNGTVTTKDKITARYTVTNPDWETLREGQYRKQSYERQVINTIPFAVRPRWVASSTWSKVVNGTAALVSQRASKKYVQFDLRKLRLPLYKRLKMVFPSTTLYR